MVLGLMVFGVLVFAFGVRGALDPGAGSHLLEGRWELIATVPFISAVAFAALWMRLCARPRGLPVGSGGFYGIALAYGTFPMAGAAAGLLSGVGAERALFFLISLLVMPDLLGALTLYGIVMGLFNGWAAHRWRDYYGR